MPVRGDITGDPAIDAVRELRARIVPEAFEGVDADPLVGGTTAENVDYLDGVTDPAPLVFAFVLGLSFLLLTVAFRSIAVAFTAIVLNLLVVGAAYGLLVLVFQEGVGADLLGFTQVDTIEAWVPLFLFAVLFGLSMDYQVFLLSRIRERYDASRDTQDAIGWGVASTARIITGAALIIVAVFVGFARGDLVMFQQMGFGVAVALLIDATIVRSVLLPSLMALLGERTGTSRAGSSGCRTSRSRGTRLRKRLGAADAAPNLGYQRWIDRGASCRSIPTGGARRESPTLARRFPVGAGDTPLPAGTSAART